MEIATDVVDRIKTKVGVENDALNINIHKVKWEIISLWHDY